MNSGVPSQPAHSGSRRRAPRPAAGPASFLPASWTREATCATADPDLFFPEDSRSPVTEAKDICAGCPVRPECLQYSLDAAEEFGVWGGLTEKERRNLLRSRNGQPGNPRPRGSDVA